MYSKAIYELADFILNEASDDEIAIVEEALNRRRQKGPLDRLNFDQMARNATARFASNMPDIKGMARDMIKNIILQNQPNIDLEHLNTLIDHYVPDESQNAEQRERQIPPDLLANMIRQFVLYSRGELASDEEQELRISIPDWPAKYWDVFSEQTRAKIRELIEA
ncbi:MAG: hypothetical protein KDK30_13265 [Leptospiraceae bacterium]|nr:hypothetical protein [Leptospiraceae bacterium]